MELIASPAEVANADTTTTDLPILPSTVARTARPTCRGKGHVFLARGKARDIVLSATVSQDGVRVKIISVSADATILGRHPASRRLPA